MLVVCGRGSLAERMGVVELHSPLMKGYVERRDIEWSVMGIAVISSYLASRHELQRA